MKVRRLVRLVFSFAASLVMAFLLLEGLSSTILCVHDSIFTYRGQLGESYYTRYDPELGWASTPGVRLPNFFGPGIGITINSQGLRGQDTAIEASGFRIVCSGDSFTFGYGVDDEHAWCSLLLRSRPQFEDGCFADEAMDAEPRLGYCPASDQNCTAVSLVPR